MEQKIIFKNLMSKIENHLCILPDKAEENAHNTLSSLWHSAAGNHVSAIAAKDLELPFLDPTQIIKLEDLINERLLGVPLAHLTERQNFMGLDYILNRGLYIPRKETEILARTAIDLLQNNYLNNNKIRVIDLCSGIGTVALAIAYYCKNTIVCGSDIYKPAVEASKINAKQFGLEKLANFYHADMYDPFEQLDLKGKTDLIVSAPPYISTGKVKHMASEISDHEPSEAFDAGPFGLSIFNKLITIAPVYLRYKGYLIFECGLGQGDFLSKRISSMKEFGEIEKICDLNGNIRVLKVRKILKDI